MKFLFAGGGTGGHVYPAVAMAKAIQSLNPLSTVEFVGTSQGIESKVIPKENFKLHIVEIGRLNSNVGLIERILTLLKLPFALIKSIYLLFKIKPNVVIGVGGYASGPIVFMAALFGYRTYIWEPNAYPGLANRILAKYVDAAFIAFEESKNYMKAKKFISGHIPVRPEIENARPRVAKTSDFCILLFGGSQGSRALNNALIDAIKSKDAWLSQVKIVHQTGSTDFEIVKKQYAEIASAEKHIECLEYLHDMPERYQWADLIIARSGIGTVAELAAMGKASILIPLPTAADDHQKKNAQALADKKATVLLEQSQLSGSSLIAEILKLKNHPERIDEMEKNIRQFHSPKAAEEMAKLLLQINKTEASEVQ